MIDVTSAYGLQFYFPMNDGAVGHSLRNHGEFGRIVVDLCLDYAGQDGVFVDAGANIGAVGLPFAKARPTWTVHAVEAHRGLAGLLAANATVNGLHNVAIHHMALGAERAIVDFPTPPLNEARNFGGIAMGQSGYNEPVRMDTLDALVPEGADIVKVDVEGYEPEVLKGAARLLATRKAIWILETVTQHPEASKETVRVMIEAGYEVYWLFVPFVTINAAKGGMAKNRVASGDANILALPPGAPNPWGLQRVRSADEQRPSSGAYAYLTRYGYA
jgi:FkbM family methyltransferase